MDNNEQLLIIKFYERFTLKVPGIPDTWPQWAKVSTVNVKENGKRITRARIKRIKKEEALSIIRELGLVKVHEDRDGRIWDTPEHSFQNKNIGLPIPLLY